MESNRFKEGWVGSDGSNTYDLYYHVKVCEPRSETLITRHEGIKHLDNIKIEGGKDIHLKLLDGAKCLLEIRTLCDLGFYRDGYEANGIAITGLFRIANLTDQEVTISAVVKEYK